MEISLGKGKYVLLAAVSILLVMIAGEKGVAGISKTTPWDDDYCNLCHLGGTGTDGTTNQSCVECHSSATSSTTYELTGGGETIAVPVVYYTGGSPPTQYLSGGNFYWVQTDDDKGHNVFFENPDDNLGEAPFRTGGCGRTWSDCHWNISNPFDDQPFFALYNRQGCTKCHMISNYQGATGYHHKDDSNTLVGSDIGDTDGYYRFLSGHMAGDGHGVCGIEDEDWQATSGSGDHNEYLGFSGTKTSAGSLSALGHTLTGFCCGCHGNKHISQEIEGGDWIRHPSGAVLCPDGPGQCGLAGYTTYEPQAPVSRPDLSGYADDPPTEDTALVVSTTDMVMCTSCHYAHGGPYPKNLRWDTASGCGTCHISATQCAQ